MMKELCLKEMREAQWKLVIGLAIAALTGASLPFAFDMIKESTHMLEGISWLSNIREQLEAQAADYRVYLWANWYGKNLTQYILVLAAIVGGTALAGEKSAGTLQFLLSRPVSRMQVFAAKYVAGAVVLTATVLGGTIATLIASSVAGRPVGTLWFLSGVPGQILGALCLLGLAMLFSAAMDDPVKAGVAAGGLSAVIMILDSTGPVRGRLLFSMMVSGRAFSTGVPHLAPVAIMAVVAVFVGLLALRVFCRRDV